MNVPSFLAAPSLPMCSYCCIFTCWLAEGKGKGWCVVVMRINVLIVICLFLLHYQLPLSAGFFSEVLAQATGAEVWHISQEAYWPQCCRCYAWGCSVLRRPQPWEHGALRNVSKYSFRLTPFLPLSSWAAATAPLLLNLGATGTVPSRLKKPGYYFKATGLIRSTSCEEIECVFLCLPLTASEANVWQETLKSKWCFSEGNVEQFL